jgi:hypothetical protein
VVADGDSPCVAGSWQGFWKSCIVILASPEELKVQKLTAKDAKSAKEKHWPANHANGRE